MATARLRRLERGRGRGDRPSSACGDGAPPSRGSTKPMPASRRAKPIDDAEERELRRHVADVRAPSSAPSRSPRCHGRAFATGWPFACNCLGRVVRPGRLAVGRREAAHLGVRQAAGGLERVDPHVLREAARRRAVGDRLVGDRAGREAEPGRPGLAATSALIAAGVMSDEPAICSGLRLDVDGRAAVRAERDRRDRRRRRGRRRR